MFSEYFYVTGGEGKPFALIAGSFAGAFRAEMVLRHLAAHKLAGFGNSHPFAVTLLHT